MKQQLEIMLDLQNDMNTRVNADWRSRNFAWYRAIWIESAEMLDHYGWKWWKKQNPDLEQVTLELVDIWHFGLSILILEGHSSEALVNVLQQSKDRPADLNEFGVELERFVEQTLSSKGFDLQGFCRLMHCVDLDFSNLFSRYVGKNVLNFFRQDHGYQDGTYQKLWGGREDNEHLVEICLTLNASDPDFKDQLYQALADRYQSSLA